jgi:hypothetical protein
MSARSSPWPSGRRLVLSNLMPIRINLLAEAHALEDLRRRDPVKRAIWIGVCLVLLVLAWSSSLQLKAMIAKGELNRVASQISTRTNEYRLVLANQQKLSEMNQKLTALQQLATNRILKGTLLDALQHATIDDVQLMRLRTEESYVYNEEIKPKTNANDRLIPGKPASVTEKVVLTLDAKDSSANPGDQVNKLKQAIIDAPYFQTVLGKTNQVRLANLSPPQVGDKPFVLFSLECRYPEKTR